MHGICHMDIPSKDFEKAKKFYGEMFNWKFNMMEGMNYMLFDAPDGHGGGFGGDGELSTKPGILFYIEVEDVASAVKKSEKLGSKVLLQKTKIPPDHGYMGVVTDLEGNQIGLWSRN